MTIRPSAVPVIDLINQNAFDNSSKYASASSPAALSAVFHCMLFLLFRAFGRSPAESPILPHGLNLPLRPRPSAYEASETPQDDRVRVLCHVPRSSHKPNPLVNLNRFRLFFRNLFVVAGFLLTT